MLSNRRTGPFRALLGLTPLITMAFSEDAGAGGSSTPPAGAPAADEGKGDKAPATPPATPPAGFVAQDVFNTRIAEERRKTEAKFAADVEKARKFDELEAAQASDLEKATSKAKGEGSAETAAKYKGVLAQAEVRAQAAGMHFRNPALAVAALNTSGTLGQIKVDDDGTVDADAVKTALAALAVSDPYLIDEGKAPEPPPAGQAGLGGATGSGATKPERQAGMGRLRGAYDDMDKNKNKPKGT